jgi:hypothetical protein
MACGIPTLSTNVEGLLDLPTEKCLPQAEDMARSILQLLPHGREMGIRQWAEVKRRFCLEPWQLAWRRIVGGLLDVNQPDDILLAQKAKSC